MPTNTDIDNSIVQQLNALEQSFCRSSPSNAFVKITVNYRSDLPDISPPAIAYVMEDGNYYLKYFTDPIFESLPYYSKHGSGWHPLDVSAPRWDRPLIIINTRWISCNGVQQDLDLLMNAFDIKGLPDQWIQQMAASIPTELTGGKVANDYSVGAIDLNVSDFSTSIPLGSKVKIKAYQYTVIASAPSSGAPSYIKLASGLIEDVNTGEDIKIIPLTDLGTLPPSCFIFRIGRKDMSDPFSELDATKNTWYITSTECSNQPTNRNRKCWNLSLYANGNPPARFDRVIHVVESTSVKVRIDDELIDKTVIEALELQKKIVPGDIIFDHTPIDPDVQDIEYKRMWDYLVPKKDEETTLVNMEFAREITVLNRKAFDEIEKYFQLTRLYIINMTHESQSWKRTVPANITSEWVIQTVPWAKQHHPAEFCYWRDAS